MLPALHSPKSERKNTAASRARILINALSNGLCALAATRPWWIDTLVVKHFGNLPLASVSDGNDQKVKKTKTHLWQFATFYTKTVRCAECTFIPYARFSHRWLQIALILMKG